MNGITQRVVLIGAKQFNGIVEGKNYDTCKLRIMFPVVQSATEIGYNTDEVLYGTSANYQQFVGLKYPIEADMHSEMALKNGRMTLTITNIDVVTPHVEKTNAKG